MPTVFGFDPRVQFLHEDDGLEVLAKLQKARPGLPVVMFTAYANIATAVEAMRRGAFDFIPKPFTPEQIRTVLAKIEKSRVLEQRVRALGAVPLGERVVLEDETYRVYADPAGHPFCLVQLEST